MAFLIASSGLWRSLTRPARCGGALTMAEGLAVWFGNEATIDRRPGGPHGCGGRRIHGGDAGRTGGA